MANFEKCKARNANKNFGTPLKLPQVSYGFNRYTIDFIVIKADNFEMQS